MDIFYRPEKLNLQRGTKFYLDNILILPGKSTVSDDILKHPDFKELCSQGVIVSLEEFVTVERNFPSHPEIPPTKVVVSRRKKPNPGLFEEEKMNFDTTIDDTN